MAIPITLWDSGLILSGFCRIVRRVRAPLLLVGAIALTTCLNCAVADAAIQRHLIFTGAKQVGLPDPSNPAANPYLWEANADGSGARRLALFGDSLFYGSPGTPALSPDGRSIALVFNNTLSVFDIGDNWDSPRRRVLYTNTSCSAWGAVAQPRWSPDGSKLVFMIPDSCPNAPSIVGSVVTINADGSGLTTLATNASERATPDFSPDGTQIAYAASTSDGSNTWIVRMNADGTSPVNLTSPGQMQAVEPRFSPDGTKIAFVQGPGTGGPIWTMKTTDGSGLLQVTPTGAWGSSLNGPLMEPI